MSNLEPEPRETTCGGDATIAEGPVHEVLTGREVVIGTRDMPVIRTLPNKERRMVGAWCFVDQYGPDRLDGRPGMRVPPHPHTQLQTVTWLVEGEVLHHDSLGNEQLIRPGQLNLMTAGRAIAHAEESPAQRSAVLHGVQLWVALPEQSRQAEPDFAHHPDLPQWSEGGLTARLLVGSLGGVTSPARSFSPLVGAELAVAPGAAVTVPIEPEYEYAVLPLVGGVEVDGVVPDRSTLLYLGRGRTELAVRNEPAAPYGRLLLLGGEPFEEQIVMWWNFIARSHDEIVAARDEWMAGRFGPVTGYQGEPLPAPPLPNARLRPRGRQR